MSSSATSSLTGAPLRALLVEASNIAALTPIVPSGVEERTCKEEGEEQRKRQRIHIRGSISGPYHARCNAA